MSNNKFVDFFGISLAVDHLVKIEWDNRSKIARAELARSGKLHVVNMSASLNKLDMVLGELDTGLLSTGGTERVWIRADRVLTVGTTAYPGHTTMRRVTLTVDAPVPIVLNVGYGDAEYIEGLRKGFVKDLERILKNTNT